MRRGFIAITAGRGRPPSPVARSARSSRTRHATNFVPTNVSAPITSSSIGRGGLNRSPCRQNLATAGKPEADRQPDRTRRPIRHCEEPLRRSNPGATTCAAPATQTVVLRPLDCFASLAMTDRIIGSLVYGCRLKQLGLGFPTLGKPRRDGAIGAPRRPRFAIPAGTDGRGRRRGCAPRGKRTPAPPARV